MKKTFLITLLAVIIAICSFGLVACGTKGNSSSKDPGVHKKIYKGDEKFTVYKYVPEKNADGSYKDTLDLSAETEILRIQKNAFNGNETLTKIILPSNIEIIDEGAFAGMRNLEEITLPFIGGTANSDAYYGQTDGAEDKSVDVERTFGYIFGTEEYSKGVTVTQTYNGTSARTFYIPATLKTVILNPAENYNIPMDAFNGNNILTTVKLNDNVIGIGESAFNNCSNLATITGQSKVETVYKNAFKGCAKLTSIDGFTALTEVKESAFENSGLTAVTLNTGVTYGKRAFAGSKLVSVIINEEVPYGCFYGCTKLASVTVNADVKIGDYAFANLDKTLVIEHTVTLTKVSLQFSGGDDKVTIAE